MADKQESITDIFWSAATADSDDRSPIPVVRHALNCVEAFEAGMVKSPASGKPVKLGELLADVGMEEDLVYASPELVRGEAFDERSLVFTLGVLIFERFTGKHPFGTSDNSKRLARLRRGEMGSGVNYIPQVPSDLRAVLMRAMGPFPEERFGSLKEMRQALRRFAGLSQPSIRPAPGKGPGQPKFFDAPTRVSSHPQLDDQGRPLDPEAAPSQQASADWMQPRRGDEAPAPLPTVKAAAPVQQRMSGGASVTEQELDNLFDEMSGKDDQRPPRPQRLTDQVVALPKPAVAASPQHEASRIAEPRVPVLAGAPQRSTLSRLMPLIYVLIGVGLTSLVFAFFLVEKSGPPQTAQAQAQAQIDEASTQPEPVEAPAPAATPAPEPAAKPAPAATPAPEAQPAPTPAPAPAPALAPASAEPPAPVAAPLAPGASPVAASGQAVFAAIRPCVPEKVRVLRVAIYLLTEGRVLRSFVAKKPGLTTVDIRCMKSKLKDLLLPMRLPKKDFVEWRFRNEEGRTTITLLRPRHLRGS